MKKTVSHRKQRLALHKTTLKNLKVRTGVKAGSITETSNHGHGNSVCDPLQHKPLCP
jgi:hypothetical protein